MSATPVAVGIDNGGTWIRLSIRSLDGKSVRLIKKPSPPLAMLPEYLKRTLKPFASRLHAVTLGSKGLWKPASKRAMKQKLRRLAPRVWVMSDVEATWLSAFPNSDTGIVLIAGTGSIAYGRKPGSFARAGGLGPKKGDEGSGYWIGKAWLLSNGKPLGARSVRQIALVARTVLKKAKRNDPLALRIAEEAQRHLVDLVARVSRKLRMRGRIPLCLHGTVLSDAWVRKGFLAEVRRRDLRVRLVHPRRTVAETLAAPLSGV